MATTRDSGRLASWPAGRQGTASAQERADARLGLLLAAPAIATILLIAVIPLGAGPSCDSLFQLSLRFENAPRPFVGLDNYGHAPERRRLVQRAAASPGWWRGSRWRPSWCSA